MNNHKLLVITAKLLTDNAIKADVLPQGTTPVAVLDHNYKNDTVTIKVQNPAWPEIVEDQDIPTVD